MFRVVKKAFQKNDRETSLQLTDRWSANSYIGGNPLVLNGGAAGLPVPLDDAVQAANGPVSRHGKVRQDAQAVVADII